VPYTTRHRLLDHFEYAIVAYIRVGPPLRRQTDRQIVLYLSNGTLYVKRRSAPRWGRTRVLSRLDASRARLFADTNAQCCTHCGLPQGGLTAQTIS